MPRPAMCTHPKKAMKSSHTNAYYTLPMRCTAAPRTWRALAAAPSCRRAAAAGLFRLEVSEGVIWRLLGSCLPAS